MYIPKSVEKQKLCTIQFSTTIKLENFLLYFSKLRKSEIGALNMRKCQKYCLRYESMYITGAPPIMAARRHCRRRLLFFKIEVRPRSCRSYHMWRPCINRNQCPKGVQAHVKESKKENKTEKSFNPIGCTKSSFPSTLHLTFSVVQAEV